MKSFFDLFRKVGGKEILRQYKQGHVLIYALIMMLLLGIDKKSLEILRLAIKNKLIKKLRRQYKEFIIDFKEKQQEIDQNPTESSKIIWICWFQGIENAPEIVQKCYKSVKENINDRQIVLITDENYQNYVTFPDFIQKKIQSGVISKTHMSDLLRLELLIRYGGTWMDATIFCTGKPMDYMLDSKLFLFQNLKPGLDGHCTSISNWFITAEVNNVILRLTLEMLYYYWNKHDQLIDYFLFHDLFQIAIEAYPEVWNEVIPVPNSLPHILLLRLFDKYDESTWKAVKGQTKVHKMTYKFNEEKNNLTGTYYDVLFR